MCELVQAWHVQLGRDAQARPAHIDRSLSHSSFDQAAVSELTVCLACSILRGPAPCKLGRSSRQRLDPMLNNDRSEPCKFLRHPSRPSRPICTEMHRQTRTDSRAPSGAGMTYALHTMHSGPVTSNRLEVREFDFEPALSIWGTVRVPDALLPPNCMVRGARLFRWVAKSA